MSYNFLKGIRSERKQMKKWMITLKSKVDVSYLSLTLSLQINHHHVYNGSKVGESFHNMHVGAIFICLSVELQKYKIILCETFTCTRHLVLTVSHAISRFLAKNMKQSDWTDSLCIGTYSATTWTGVLGMRLWERLSHRFLKTQDSKVFQLPRDQ